MSRCSRHFGLILLVGAFCLTLSGCMRAKDEADAQVRALCVKDGGLKVYERVKLPREKSIEFGELRLPAKRNLKPSDEFFYEWDLDYLRRGNPEVTRSHFKLFRIIDGRLLGEAVSYSRRGGDLPGPWHPSTFACPERGDLTALRHAIFFY